ncbi:MFS domain-containing protein [Durusdinium trenchii]|uniref:MFS domain-containing protein n=1 Tax=Durusdinium trenchii TaxID=1381693 RepID=A0ABP0MQM8_9DINO
MVHLAYLAFLCGAAAVEVNLESKVRARQPLLREHHAPAISPGHAAVLAAISPKGEVLVAGRTPWQRGDHPGDVLAVRDSKERVKKVQKGTGTQGTQGEKAAWNSGGHRVELWLAGCLSALGSFVTFVWLYQAKKACQAVAPEESLSPRPGTVTSTMRILCITSLSISYGAMISSMTIFVLPKEAEHFYPSHASMSLGLLELLGAACLLCGPVAGLISDRIKHPMGRRRPMVLLLSQLAVTGTIGCWLSSTYRSPAAFAVCLLVQQIGWNSAHAAHNALLSDIIHPSCTGLASSIQTINVLLGGMLGMLSFQALAHAGVRHNYIYAVQAGITYLFLPVTHFSAQEAGSHGMLLPSNPISLQNVFFSLGEAKSPDFVLVMWERGFYYVAAASKSFLLYFARDMLKITSEMDQALLLSEASVSTVGAAVLGGLLSSILFTRTAIRPQKVACCGSLILAMGSQFWICLFFHGFKTKKMMLLLFLSIYGFGKGSYMSADLALTIDTMPDPDEASRYLGLWGLSAFLGAGLGGLAMSMILEFFGETLPASYGMHVKPGTYCIHGYVALLLLCFCCQIYVAHLCLRIRTRREYEQGLVVKRRTSKTNAFLLEPAPPKDQETLQQSKPEETVGHEG